MKARLFPTFVTVVVLLCAAHAFGQVATSTRTPTRTTTPTFTPTSNRANDLSITKSVSPNPGRVGEDMTYTLTVHNAGPASFAPNVTLHDSLPANVTLVSVTAPDWTCSSSSTSVSCETTLFFAGSTKQIVIVVRPTAVGSFTNTALVQCTFVTGCFDPNLSNNTATITTEVVATGNTPTRTPTPTRTFTPTFTPTSNRTADLSVTKIAAPSPVRVGENLTYTITAHNSGPNFAMDFSLTDDLPADVEFVSVFFPAGTCSHSSTQVQCYIPFLFFGPVQAVIVVKPTRVGSLTNTVRVSCPIVVGCFDPDPSNNMASVTTDVQDSTNPVPLYLRGNGNPVVLSLDAVAPTSAAAKYRDSAVLGSGLRNPWVEIGAWPAPAALISGTFVGLGDFHGWLGLKNSDDQGTQFDLRAEVWKNGIELVGAGETACIKGLVRDPASARDTTVPLDLFTPVDFDGITDSLSLKVLARIGTHCSGPSHAGATGLRFYYDGVTRPSRFALTPGLRLQ